MTELTLNRHIDCSNEFYHSTAGISKSHLDVIASRSPKHYWQSYINPNREERVETPAMKMGTAIHTAILEPHDFDNRIVRGLDIDRRSNDNKARWADFERLNANKIIVKADDYDYLREIRDALHSHPVAAGLLSGGKAEQTLFAVDPDTGELIKSRKDYIHDSGMVVDVKSTDDASPIAFAKSVANYRYDVQAAWYYFVDEVAFGAIPSDWVFVAFEKEPPFAVGVYFLTSADISRARDTAMRDYRRIVDARRDNYWPDYGVVPQVIELPGWVKR